MSDAKKYFKKVGGLGLIKQYCRAGVLWEAVLLYFTLGKSKKALEILRLAVTMKTQRRLEKKYKETLKNLHYDESQGHVYSKKIWVFWWQGIENAPRLVKRCFQSVKENLSDWEIILVTEHNYKNFCQFPEIIIKKMEEGQITLTHFSDLLRLELLIKHGGLWLDATVLCTNSDIPQSILNSDLFVYQAQKPGADGHAVIMSSWCMFARTNNIILIATRELLYNYWKKNTKMDDYFLLHQFFTIACNYYPEEARKIPPFSNSIPHILLLHLFERYDNQYWEDLKRMTCFHKLSYKLDAEKMKIKGSYYDQIINNQEI